MIRRPASSIAAPRSGSGKTTLTLGLMRAFGERGLDVVGAKSGRTISIPPFTPRRPGATGSISTAGRCRRRSSLASPRAPARAAISCSAKRSMGLFDGVPAEPGRSGASADVAATLGCAGAACRSTSPARRNRRRRSSRAAPPTIRASRSPASCSTASAARGIGGWRAKRSRRSAFPSSARCRASTTWRCPNAISASSRRWRRTISTRGSIASPTSSPRMSIWTALRALARPLRARRTRRAPAALPPPGQRIAIARDAAFSFLYPHMLSGWRDARRRNPLLFAARRRGAARRTAISAGCPAAIPNCTPGGSPAPRVSSTGLRRFARRRRCMANAAATWCSAPR